MQARDLENRECFIITGHPVSIVPNADIYTGTVWYKVHLITALRPNIFVTDFTLPAAGIH
jgi:hypothetical protein